MSGVRVNAEDEATSSSSEEDGEEEEDRHQDSLRRLGNLASCSIGTQQQHPLRQAGKRGRPPKNQGV